VAFIHVNQVARATKEAKVHMQHLSWVLFPQCWCGWTSWRFSAMLPRHVRGIVQTRVMSIVGMQVCHPCDAVFLASFALNNKRGVGAGPQNSVHPFPSLMLGSSWLLDRETWRSGLPSVPSHSPKCFRHATICVVQHQHGCCLRM
jgi:hypothetical protein